MSQLLTAARASGTGASGAWYTQYVDYPWFADLATTVAAQLTGATVVLLAGCGYGYLLNRAVQAIPQAQFWGCDASAFAVAQAKALLPAASAARVLTGDCTSSASMAGVRTAAGLHGNQTFDLIVTEDLLSCCASDAEVTQMLTVLRATGKRLLHLITMLNPDGLTVGVGGTPILNNGVLWKTPAQWQALVGVGEPIYSIATLVQVQ